MSQMMINSKELIATCTSQPVAFCGHLSTHGFLTAVGNKPQKKQTSQLLAVVLR